MLKKIIFITIVFSSVAEANPIKLSNTYIEVRKIGLVRDPYFPNKEDWTYNYSMNYTINFTNWLFWENSLHFRGDASQIRHAGWKYTIGVKLTDYLDVVHFHHSQHGMENINNDSKFPLENSYGLRLKLIP